MFGTNQLIQAQNLGVESVADSIGTAATPYFTAGTTAATKAAEQYVALTKLDPKDAESWYEAGVWWQNAGQYQKALDSYRRFTTLVPADPAIATIEAQISALSRCICRPRDHGRADDAEGLDGEELDGEGELGGHGDDHGRERFHVQVR